MQPFDPIGTTIHEERWTGRDVMRGMSEELSELDEDELKDLVEDELGQDSTKAPAGAGGAAGNSQQVRRTRRRR
jgi:NuA3 HAT complex component NTO1